MKCIVFGTLEREVGEQYKHSSFRQVLNGVVVFSSAVFRCKAPLGTVGTYLLPPFLSTCCRYLQKSSQNFYMFTFFLSQQRVDCLLLLV